MASRPAARGAYSDLKTGRTAAIAGNVLGRPLDVTSNIDNLGAGTANLFGYDPEQVWIVRRCDFKMIHDPFTKAEQVTTRLILEFRFGVSCPRPGIISVATVLTP